MNPVEMPSKLQAELDDLWELSLTLLEIQGEGKKTQAEVLADPNLRATVHNLVLGACGGKAHSLCLKVFLAGLKEGETAKEATNVVDGR